MNITKIILLNDKKYLLIIVLLFMSVVTFSGNTDSLKSEFYSTNNIDEKWINAYKIAKQTIYSKPDTAFKYLHAAIKDSTFNPQSENLANCLNSLGVYYLNNHNFDSVIYYSSKALKIFIANGNPGGSIKMRKNIALAKRSMGDYQSALKSFFEILEFNKSDSNDVRVAAILNDIGNTYLYLKDYQKGIHYQNEALKYLEGQDNAKLAGNIYNSFGYAYSALENGDSAIFYYEKSLELKLKSGDIYGIANTRNNLCTQIDYKSDPEKCEDCLLELLKDQKKINDSKGIARAYINLAVQNSYYNKCGASLSQLDSAGYYLGFSNDIFLKQQYFKQYAKALKKCNKNRLAYIYLDSLMKLNDSIFEFQKQKEIIELDTKYQTQQKVENIKMLEAENAYGLLKVQKQRWQISFLVFFLVIIVGGGILSFFLFKQRQKKLRELAVLKMREEERIRIAHDMHDEIGSGLTRISLISEQVKLASTLDNKTEKSNISKIISQSRLLSKNLKEIVWAIDPSNDKLSELLFYLRDYIYEFSSNTYIDCSIDFPDEVTDFEVGSDVRRNVFLSLKEILNNIAKYAQAKKVSVVFTVKDGCGFLVVSDNGVGFDMDNVKKGTGLQSIKSRTEKLKGKFSLKSEINKGTVISLHGIKLY